MEKSLLLIDYENIQELSKINNLNNVEVKVFVGLNQTKIPVDIVINTQKLGLDLQWIKINGQGKNALDFHIAFYLGFAMKEDKFSNYYVLSKDGGYDPLITHLKSVHKKKARRITNIGQLTDKQMATKMTSDMTKLVDHLKKIQGNSRPKKKKTLVGFAMSAFSNKKSIDEVDEVIESLFMLGKLTENNGLLKYSI